jgi:hypothetical protein
MVNVQRLDWDQEHIRREDNSSTCRCILAMLGRNALAGRLMRVRRRMMFVGARTCVRSVRRARPVRHLLADIIP